LEAFLDCLQQVTSFCEKRAKEIKSISQNQEENQLKRIAQGEADVSQEVCKPTLQDLGCPWLPQG
jgi:hypothetical protein